MVRRRSADKKPEIWSMEWGSWLLQILLEVEMIHLKSSKKSRPIRILARAELTKSMIHYLVRGVRARSARISLNLFNYSLYGVAYITQNFTYITHSQ